MNHSLHALRVSTHHAACGLALAALLATAVPPVSWAANSPKPPDNPTPIEGRIAIGADTTPGDADSTPSLFKITQPGSYYLKANIAGVPAKSGIEIVASGVTIDLNGFSLQGVAGSLNGVNVTAVVRQVTVRNGTVAGWKTGIHSHHDDGRFHDLTITGNSANGLWSGPTSIITDCVVSLNGEIGVRVGSGAVLTRVVTRNNQDGIQVGGTGARLVDCSANSNALYGIYAAGESNSLTGCTASSNGEDGFQVGSYASIEGCTAQLNTGNGFSLGASSTVSRANAFLNSVDGFKTYSGTVLIGCIATSNIRDGFAGGPQTRLENCSATSNARHGFSTGTGSQIRGCTARLNVSCGYTIDGYSHVESNVALSNGLQAPAGFIGAGFNIIAGGCRLDGNTAGLNAAGFLVQAGNAIILRNCARGNTGGNYVFSPGAEYAQIITNPGAAFIATNPWANFAY